MEQQLDEIAEGTTEWVPFIETFYGPFSTRVTEKTKEIKKEDVMGDRELGVDTATGLPIFVKTGRFGAYVQLGAWEKPKKGERKSDIAKPKAASLLRGMSPETVTMEEAKALLSFPRSLGTTDAGEPIELLLGRFGPYFKIGEKSLSLPKDVNPLEVDLTKAKELIAAGPSKGGGPLQSLGNDPVSGKEVTVRSGRFGPYVTDGITNCSISKKIDPTTITLEIAAALLEKKRHAPPRKWGRRGKANG